MKKNTVLILLLILTLCATMFMTACGGSSSSEPASSTDTASEEEVEEEAEEPAGPANLEEYMLANPDVVASIEEGIDSSSMTVTYEGNSIIYTYDFSIESSGLTKENFMDDAVKDSLNTALDEAKAEYGGYCKDMESSTGYSPITIVVNYTWEDEVIVTKTYTTADAG